VVLGAARRERSFWREWYANMLGTGHGVHEEGLRRVTAEVGS
jgi:hypothetical protein